MNIQEPITTNETAITTEEAGKTAEESPALSVLIDRARAADIEGQGNRVRQLLQELAGRIRQPISLPQFIKNGVHNNRIPNKKTSKLSQSFNWIRSNIKMIILIAAFMMSSSSFEFNFTFDGPLMQLMEYITEQHEEDDSGPDCPLEEQYEEADPEPECPSNEHSNGHE